MIDTTLNAPKQPSCRFLSRQVDSANEPIRPFPHGLAVPPWVTLRARRVFPRWGSTFSGNHLLSPTFGDPTLRNRVGLQDNPTHRRAASSTPPPGSPRLRQRAVSSPLGNSRRIQSYLLDRPRHPRSNNRARLQGVRAVDVLRKPRPPPLSGVPDLP